VLIIPILVLFTFVILPTILAGYYSLTDFNMITAPIYIKLKNFIDLFADPVFIFALRNTTYYMFGCVILQVLVGLGLAMIVTREWLRGKVFFRTVYFLPVVLSMVAVAIVWQWVFDSRVGLMNFALELIHIAPQPWLTSAQQALLVIILISVWKFSGYNVVLFTAAIQNIPVEYYEAASVDGSNGLTDFWYITLPLIRPTILFTVITSAIGSFQVFDSVYVITQGMGGPSFSTMTLLVYLYKHAFDGMRFGYGSAVSIVMFAILLVLTLVELKIGGLSSGESDN
jgi:ABC-type sugar transport system permease subunit